MLAQLARDLRARYLSLQRLPARKIVQTVAGVHREWARPRSRWRKEAVELLAGSTGYPRTVLDRSLQRLFAGMQEEELLGWLTEGCASPELLDIHSPGAVGPILVCGPALTVVIAGGNVPGAAVPSVAQCLLLKSPCLVKSSSAEPFLLPLYARSVAEASADLGGALAVVSWPGGQAELEAAVLAEAEALIAYGSDEAIRALRSQLPAQARFIGYGHRISFSAIGKEWLAGAPRAAETARLAARDLCLFDQQGCYSPQAIYVERGRGVSPEAFGELLAAALEELDRALPRRRLSAEESAAIHQYRAEMEMRALAEPGTRCWSSSQGTRWTVVLDQNPELEPCVLNRTAVIRPVDDLEALPRWLSTCRAGLMTAALGVGERRFPRVVRGLAAAGVKRITRLGSAQEPEGALHHDGVNAIATLARYVRIEGAGRDTGSSQPAV